MTLHSRLAVSLLIATLAPSQSHADAISDFYKVVTIRLIISADAGGSYDSDARLVARHLGKHIPGNPRIVPENMLGASGRVAANYMYHSAPKDGTVIAVMQQSLPMGQALGEPGIQYDAAKFNWIGSPVRPDETLVVWHTTGVRSIEDAKKKEVIIGATSPTGMNYVYPKLANELLGTKFEIVTITGELGRPFIAPPGLPAERVAALRQAFDATMQDPEFLADAATAQKEIRPIGWEEMEKLVQRVLSSPKSATDLLKSALAR